MKKLFLLVFFLNSFTSFSQELSKNLYGYTKSYKLESLSKKEIHSRVKEWIGQNFVSPLEATKFDDENKIIVERNFKMSPKLIQTFQNTTSNYKVSCFLNFFISENKLLLEMHLNDVYSFDGKKGAEGDAMTKKAIKYVDKEIKKGIFIKRIIKVSNLLNKEVREVYSSIERKLGV